MGYTVQGSTYKTGQSNTVSCDWQASGYRLPTEAEWEYAARGNRSGARFPWGDTISHQQANYFSTNSYSYDVSGTRGYHPSYLTGGQPYTAPVGSFAANDVGLFDMAGNVFEWCWDWMDVTYYTYCPEENPRGPSTGTRRLVKGGGWVDRAFTCRPALRYDWPPELTGIQVGFRPVRWASDLMEQAVVRYEIFTNDSLVISVDTRPVTAPFNFVASAFATNWNDLSWGDASPNETGFRIERHAGAGIWSMIGWAESNASHYADEAAISGTTYYYRVVVSNMWGSLAYSATNSVRTMKVPVAPSNVTAEAVSFDEVLLGWSHNAESTEGYLIERKMGEAGDWSQIGNTVAQVVSYRDTGLEERTLYYYRVAVTNQWGLSACSTVTGVATYAEASVSLTGLSQTYNGLARTVTATTVPAGLTVVITYNGSLNAPVNAGSYSVTGTVDHAEYKGSATGTLVVGKAAAQVFLSGLSQSYNGTARTVTATTVPAGLTVVVTYNGSPSAPMNAGTYAVTGTVADANYAGSAAGTLSVSKVGQAITFPAIGPQCTTNRVTLSATASSGLPVSFAVVSGPGTISGGNILSFTGWGTVLVAASQAGDVNWYAAPAKTNTVLVTNMPPVVCVATQQIFLASMGDMATLDASCSHDRDGEPLFFSWREYYGNPQHGLLPANGESLDKVSLFFPTSGRYQFEVRVSDGLDMSAETRTITVYVPGRKGIVGFTPSDGIVRVPDAKIRVHNTAADAQNNVNQVDCSITESFGKYFLENIEPQNNTTARTYWYVVERTGFASSEAQQMTVRPDPGFTDSQYDEAIGRGFVASLSGRVVRASGGAAIENAIVSIVPGLGGQHFTASTGIDGSFRLSNVPQGSWIMQLRADGFQPEVRDISVAAGMPELQFTMTTAESTASLAGTVTLAGTDRPVGGAKVSLGTGSEATANAAGQYSFSSIPLGDYIVTITKTGYEPLRLPVVQVQAGANTLNVPMYFASRGPLVFGAVTDATDGRPVRLATVGIQSTAGLFIRSDISDRTGYYQLQDTPVGIQSFRVSAPGYQTKTFNVDITASLNVNIQLERSEAWVEPAQASASLPVARVGEAFVFLDNMHQSATLDGSPSSGANLRYIWRESPDNPTMNLLPSGSESMPAIQVGGFEKPGIYRYDLQVSSGSLLSRKTASITVYAPGLAGNVHASPSDGLIGLNAATVRAYSNYADALAWQTDSSLLDSIQTEESPVGNFALASLSTGRVWLVARAQTGSGFNQYGPVPRRVNYSSAARSTRINVPRDEFVLAGKITDSLSGVALENVRIVVAPGSLSESFRTTTDATGQYKLSAVPKGSAQPVMLMKNGYRTRVSYLDISANNTNANMTLQKNSSGGLATLRGTVSSDYEGFLLPVANAEVIIGSGVYRTFTDANGAYRMDNLPPGDYYGTIRKDGYIPSGLADFTFVTLASGTNTINKTLVFEGHGPVVQGVALNENHEPIPGAQITVLPPVGVFRKGKKKGDATETADGGGVFQLVGLSHGTHSLRVSLPSGTTLTTTVYVADSMELVITTDEPLPAPDAYILVSGDLAFHNVTTNMPATRTMTIRETGGAGALHVSAISYPAGFSGAWTGTVAAGGSTTVPVVFLPTAAQSYDGTITVVSDAASGANTLGCSGHGVTMQVSPEYRSQYDLPQDGSADFTDTDLDGYSNWEEWLANTNPNDPSDYFQFHDAIGRTASGFTIYWPSATGRTYEVQRSTNLMSSPQFSILATGIVGHAQETSYTDTNNFVSPVRMYKVDIEVH